MKPLSECVRTLHIQPLRAGAAFLRVALPVLVGGALLLGVAEFGNWPAQSAVVVPPATAPQGPKGPEIVRVSADQLHQLSVAPVKPAMFRTSRVAIGQIAFNEDASTVVLTPFAGRITRVLAKVGDDIKRGDPLFEIDSPEVAQAQADLITASHTVDKAKSQMALAKRVVDRQTALQTDRATSQREVDQARGDYAAAELDLKIAQGALSAARNKLRVIIGRDTTEVDRVEQERVINPLITINAPIDGTVIARKVGLGQYVRSDAGDSLYSIANLSTMWLKANVPEIDIPLVKVGQELEVKVSALPDRVFKAQVIAIGAASDSATRRVTVRSEIANPDRALKSEMFAAFKIMIGDGMTSPAVPIDAVIWEAETAFVWVEREPMAFERRQVKTGLEQNRLVQILAGVAEDDLVVGRGGLFIDNESRQ
jgi:cobalt-zinc-cadmium efflux system membrane fusion protein